jgi:hypothetical protein
MFLVFLYFIVIVKACKFNACICGDGVVICERTDEMDPYFSRDEVIEMERLEITDTQLLWFADKCGSFPRLQGIYFRDKTACPPHTCVPCL